jgi:hypothetical protein
MSAPSSAPASEAEVLRVYDEKRGKVRMLIGKIGELENELSEHKRVGDMLAPMDGARRAFQLVNGVLGESTVADVRPVVGQNQAGLREVLEKLGKQLSDASNDVSAYQERYKISNRPNEATLPALAPGSVDDEQARTLAL